MSSLMECRQVSLGYEGQKIWENLTFSVESGDYLCIVGENGSGKSTLLKGLLGLLAPMAGTITYAPAIRAGAIGYLPQQSDVQKQFPATVEEVVLSGFLNRSRFLLRYTPAMKAEALMHMGKLGVLELKDRSYRDLSGGQQQRVLLSRALCAAGQLLVLDEPVAGLDPQAIGEFYHILRFLHDKEHKTILMVTHDMTHALKEASHIFCVKKGGQFFYGTTEEFRATQEGKRWGGDLR